MIAAAVLLLSLGADIAVTVAPDQPVPVVYVDEPLLIELRADSDVELDAQLALAAPNRTPVTVDLGAVALKAGAARWRAIEGLPPTRGLYTVRLTFDLEGQQQTHERIVCRIDRPARRPLEWLVPLTDGVDAADIQLLRAAPFASAALPMHAAVALDPGFRKPPAPKWIVHILEPAAEPGALRRAFPEAAWWSVDIPDAAGAGATIRAIDADRGQAPLAYTLRTPAEAGAAIDGGLHRIATHWRIAWNDREPLRNAIDAALAGQGVEHMPWIAAAAPADGADLVRTVLAARRADARYVELPFAALYDGGVPSPLLPYACALAHRLGGARYAGPLDLGDPYRAEVFTRDGAWIAVLWTAAEPAEIRLVAGAADQVRAYDGLNNPLPAIGVEDGELPILVAPEPRYVEGAGGTIPAQAARYLARLEAEALIDGTSVETLLPEAMFDAVARAAADNIDRLPRREFLLLLQAFPQLEQLRQREPAQGPAILAAAEGLTRMLRHLCTVEQETGDPFLEPYTDLLARADEMTAQYVTGQTGAGQETSGRAEWLFAEITRIGDEARAMAAANRPIEADALASLAEWRARSLRYAMTAPAAEAGNQTGPTPAPPDSPSAAP